VQWCDASQQQVCAVCMRMCHAAGATHAITAADGLQAPTGTQALPCAVVARPVAHAHASRRTANQPRTLDVQMTSRRWMFIHESTFTRWPL
jgi:hypothetical protein